MADGTENDIQEINEKLDELQVMARENHQMIRTLYKRAKLAVYAVFFKWFIIIGITLGAFYIFQPIIDSIVSIYSGFTGGDGQDLFNTIKSI